MLIAAGWYTTLALAVEAQGCAAQSFCALAE